MAFTDVLKKAYPFLSAAASLVPGGNLAATALGQILNLKEGSTLDDAGIALMTATPEQRAQLQAEDNRHKEAITQMGFSSAEEFERIAAADRADARQREIKTGDLTPRVLAYCILAATFLLEGIFAWEVFHGHSFTSDGAIIIGRILGTLDTSAALVIGYFYGSSAGSAKKDEMKHAEILAQQ